MPHHHAPPHSLVKNFTLPPLLEKLQNYNPDWRVHVNLAFNYNPAEERIAPAGIDPIAISNTYSTGWGTYVTPSNALGQTMLIPKGISKIAAIELYLDNRQWTAGETLTLSIWDSPEKDQLFGQASLAASNNGSLPHFIFGDGVAVPSGTTVYFELTHSGGQDNSVGWVVYSNYDTYKDGTAYERGLPISRDFYFRVYAKRHNDGDGFENFVDDWVNLSGTDYIQSTTAYPWLPSWFESYFSALELLRGRGLAHNLPYGAYLQSLPLSWGSMGPDPNAAMMRFNAYTALTYGAKQLNWFTYWTPINVYNGRDLPGDWPSAIVNEDGSLTAKYDVVKTLNAELHRFGALLKDVTSRRVFHTGAPLPQGVRALPGAFFVRPSDVSWPLVFGYFTGSSGKIYGSSLFGMD
jgi:hypothetical protein